MNQLTAILKQHTPMIHFQHNESGATLRASEVKPLLDKFILTKLGNGDIREGRLYAKKNNWLIDNEKNYALNYKLSISLQKKSRLEYLITSSTFPLPTERPSNFFTIQNSPYFAQEKCVGINTNSTIILKKSNSDPRKKEAEFKEKNWSQIDKKGLEWQDFTIKIFSLKGDLINKIQTYLPAFFICHNFGTRNNKGFGSFTVEYINNQKNICNVEDTLKENFAFVYKKKIALSRQSTLDFIYIYNQIFSTIKKDYQILKSGYNFRNEYIKSLLFCYFVSKYPNYRWEKRKMKQLIKARGYELKGDHSPISGIRENDNSWNDPNPNGYNYAYIRAILGLAEQYEFQLETPYQKAIVKIKSANNCISRYKSPLLFEIINNSIYLVGNEINTEILNKPFQYSYIEQTKNKNMRTGKSEITERTMHINEIEMNYNNRINYHYTPTSFSLIDFMQYAMSYKKNGKNILNYIPLKQ